MLVFLHVSEGFDSSIFKSEFWPLLVLALIYLGMVGPLRGTLAPGARFPRRQTGLFMFGLWLLYFSITSYYLDYIGERYLFSVHMLQHCIIIFVVPIFLLLGTPGWIIRPFLAVAGVQTVMRFLTRPTVAFLVFNLIFAFWHKPGMFEWALRWKGAHALEHVAFLGSAILMWWPVLSPSPELPSLEPGPQIVYYFLLSISQIPIFFLLAFAGSVYYPTYQDAARISLGGMMTLTPMQDQQLGGIIMKIVGEIVFIGGIGYAFSQWLKTEKMPRAVVPSVN